MLVGLAMSNAQLRVPGLPGLFTQSGFAHSWPGACCALKVISTAWVIAGSAFPELLAGLKRCREE